MMKKNLSDLQSLVLGRSAQFLESQSPGKLLIWSEATIASVTVQTNLTSFLNNSVVTLFFINQVKTYHRVYYSPQHPILERQSVILYISKSVSFFRKCVAGLYNYFFLYFSSILLFICLYVYILISKFSTIFCVTALHALNFVYNFRNQLAYLYKLFYGSYCQ